MRVRSFCACVGLTFSLVCLAETPALTDMEQLNREVQEFLSRHYQQTLNSDIEIKVKRLDPRLRLAHCDQALSFELRDTGSTGGNVSVHTRCPGSQPWALYIGAQVKIFAAVVVANRNIPKGTVLALNDLDIQVKDTTTLSVNYIADTQEVLGKATARTIRVGEAMRYALITEPIAIKRGDTVVVEAQSGAILVSTQGVAMADGRVGDQISVRNSQSERIVRVEILGPGRAKVIM